MGHPRGTGFVKFKRREDAEKCVETSEGKEGVFLDNRQLNILMAKEKGDVEQIQKERKEKEPKDNRNLYLAREGIILEQHYSQTKCSPSRAALMTGKITNQDLCFSYSTGRYPFHLGRQHRALKPLRAGGVPTRYLDI